MTTHLHTQSSSENMDNADAIIGKPMSIKDRIRTLNLVAERSSVMQAGSRGKAADTVSTPVDETNNIAANITESDGPTLMKKQKHDPDPDSGVGNDDKTVADAMTMWRRRKVQEKKVEAGADQSDFEEDTNDKVEQWTISDLTKTSRQILSSSPASFVENNNFPRSPHRSVEKTQQGIEPVSSIKTNNLNPISFEKLNHPKKNLRTVDSSLQQIPTNSRAPISHQNDYGFVMPKLKPVRRAPHTLALVTAATSPQRIAGNDSTELQDETKKSSQSSKTSINLHRKPLSQISARKTVCSPSRVVVDAVAPSVLKKNERNTIATIDSTACGDGNIKITKSSTENRKVKEPHSRSLEIDIERSPKEISPNKSSKTVEPSTNTPLKAAEKRPVYSPKTNDVGKMKKIDTPKRSKISERIKAFSSAANGGTSWKKKSPTRFPVVPRATLNSTNLKRGTTKIFPQQGEESSCTSSERQSNDDDSISVSTPMATGTPARLGAHPPTPNSYSSEAAYTSIASSGDGAVAGSIESNQQSTKSDEMQYSNVSTPGSSVHEDSSILPPQEDKAELPKAALKITLRSKLEYDKQRAVRRSRIKRRQMKVPSALVAAQKKAQNQDMKPVWGSKSPGIETTPTRQSPEPPAIVLGKALDGDPTMTDHEGKDAPLVKTNPDGVRNKIILDRIDSSKMTKKISAPQVSENIIPPESEFKVQEKVVGNKSMKADVMKQLIKRRRRRKEFQAGKKKNISTGKKDDPVEVQSIRKPTKLEKPLNEGTKFPPSKNIDLNSVPKSLDSDLSRHEALKDNAIPSLTPAKAKTNDSSSSPTALTDLDRLCVPLVPPENPPLPPDIIRSTSSKDTSSTQTQLIDERDDISFTPETSNNISKEDVPAPSDSISVTSSVLFDEYPDDDDEPEPDVDIDDEPEPDVDSFIDMDLSPIKSNDISKHIFDTSASYRGSPESINKPSLRTPTQSPPRVPGHIRDVMVSNSTPKRANRHVSLRNVGEMLYSSKGTPLDSATIVETASPIHRAGSDMSEEPFDQQSKPLNALSTSSAKHSPLRDRPQVKDSGSLFRNHCSDAFSDVSSGFRSVSTTSAASSSQSTISSRANRILAERRAQLKKKSEPEIGIDRSHATFLARKIMNGPPNIDQNHSSAEKYSNTAAEELFDEIMPPSHHKSSVPESTDEIMPSPQRRFVENINHSSDNFTLNTFNSKNAIGTALQSAENRSECKGEDILQSNAIHNHGANEERENNPSVRSNIDEEMKGEANESVDTSTSDLYSTTYGNQNKTADSSTFDFIADVSDLYGASLYDSQETNTSLAPEAGCTYPLVCNDENKLMNNSWLQMDKYSTVSSPLCLGSLPESDILDVSAVSAVRISQRSDDDDDAVPFDEEVSGAIEVEYIPNDKIMTASQGSRINDNILMHINSNVSINSKDKENALNYISASSCDTTDDPLDIPMRLKKLRDSTF